MISTRYNKPHFANNEKDTRRYKELRNQVYLVLETLPRSRHTVALVKAFLLPVLYILIYLLALFSKSQLIFYSCYVLLGFLVVIIFLNLIHEVCHDNIFRNNKINRAYLLFFDLIGANSYMWKKRHIMLHHNFTNVVGWDSDIEKSKFLKVHPEDKEKWLVRYQHLMILLYPLFITNWFLIRDFKDFFNKSMIVRKLGKVPLVEYFKLFFFKLFFVGYLVVIPAFVTPFSLIQCLLALFIMLFSAGLFALIVLLPPHVNTSNQFPSVDDKLNLNQSWLRHQLNTTNDVNGYNWFTRHVMANFNFHLAHHLFPNISYVYAKEVTDVIRKYNLRNGLTYRSYPLSETFMNHYRLIRKNSQNTNIFEKEL